MVAKLREVLVLGGGMPGWMTIRRIKSDTPLLQWGIAPNATLRWWAPLGDAIIVANCGTLKVETSNPEIEYSLYYLSKHGPFVRRGKGGTLDPKVYLDLDKYQVPMSK